MDGGVLLTNWFIVELNWQSTWSTLSLNHMSWGGQAQRHIYTSVFKGIENPDQMSIHMWKFLSQSQKCLVFCCTNKLFLLTECQRLPENGILILSAKWSLFRVWRMSNTNTTGIRSQHWEMWNIMSIKNRGSFQEYVTALLNTELQIPATQAA